jgi:hypothetical protein
MRTYILAALLLGMGIYQVHAAKDLDVGGVTVNTSTLNKSVAVTSGNTFQQLLPSIIGNAGARRQSLTIQNSQASGTDNCWIYIGPIGNATKATAILLAPGQAYGRYWPYVPSDQIAGTCSGTGDTMYVDVQ